MTPIMGNANASKEQMSQYLSTRNDALDAMLYAIMYLQEGKVEGVRGDIAFAQSCLETGNFKFGGDVTADQNNFAGIGTTGGGVKGASFSTPQLGIRAQIQHLKAYASDEALNQECVDPRFVYVTRKSAEYVEYLGIQENPNHKGWASGANYGTKILTILNDILKIEVTSSNGDESTKTEDSSTTTESEASSTDSSSTQENSQEDAQETTTQSSSSDSGSQVSGTTNDISSSSTEVTIEGSTATTTTDPTVIAVKSNVEATTSSTTSVTSSTAVASSTKKKSEVTEESVKKTTNIVAKIIETVLKVLQMIINFIKVNKS